MPRQNNFSMVRVLEVDIDIITVAEAVELITNEAKKPPARYVSKPYVEFFDDKLSGNDNKAISDTDIKPLLNDAFLCLPEGVAVQWAAYYHSTSGSLWQLFKTLSEIVFAPQRLKSVIPEKFGGTNFTWPLLEAAARKNLDVYLVGSPAKNGIEHTAEYLQANIKGLRITGTHPGRDQRTGTFSDSLEQRLSDDLLEKRPDIILVGLGFPLQEHLIRRLAKKLDHGVLIGEGGTFDYRSFGGKFQKAPKALQVVGLEWLWRLLLQPKRIKRQLAIPRFIGRIYRSHPHR